MKKLFCSLFILLISSSAFSDTNIKEPEENTPKVNSLNYTHFKRKEMDKDEMFLDMKNRLSYGYFKVGANPFIQNIGIGKRFYVNSTSSFDISFNLYASSLLFYNNEYILMPSLKYSYLKYNNGKNRGSYKGIGYELGIYTNLTDKTLIPIPIPNIEFIWGKERESIKFSQLSLNLAPIAVGIWASTVVYVYYSSAPILSYLALTGASAISYTIGFWFII